MKFVEFGWTVINTAINSYLECSLSGHMISSITEGEVKEKEAVVFRGDIKCYQTVSIYMD